MPTDAAAVAKRKRWHAVLDRIPVDRPVVGVEIGVWRGIMSRELLAARPLLTLHLVDPWLTGEPGTPWWQSGSVMPARSQAEFHQAYLRTIQVTDWCRERAPIHRAKSVEVAACFPHPVDFAFVDGDHSFEGAKADIEAWWPHVLPGGWIGGHDWDKPERGQVTRAVLSVFPLERVQLDAESTWFVPNF